MAQVLTLHLRRSDDLMVVTATLSWALLIKHLVYKLPHHDKANFIEGVRLVYLRTFLPNMCLWCNYYYEMYYFYHSYTINLLHKHLVEAAGKRVLSNGNKSKREQGFIQAILMSVRLYKKLNLLIEYSNSMFIKFYFKAYWFWPCIQNKLA